MVRDGGSGRGLRQRIDSGAARAPALPERVDASVSPLSYQPLYRQIAREIEARIARGDFAPGAMIPSEIDLAAELGASQGTVRRAIEEMVQARLLHRKQGKGTYVASHGQQPTQFRFLRLRRDDGEGGGVTSRVLNCRRVRPPVEVARALSLPGEGSVLFVRRELLSGDTPVVLDDIWLAGDEFRGITLDRLRQHRGSLYALFESELGTRMVAATESLKAVNANATQAKLLGVKEGDALLAVDRVTSTFHARPVEFRRGFYCTKKHHYFSELR